MSSLHTSPSLISYVAQKVEDFVRTSLLFKTLRLWIPVVVAKVVSLINEEGNQQFMFESKALEKHWADQSF